ncbi:hypothetical protein CYY_005519 [Polysphondylium violaceum]|uniref:Mitochondrial adapter protein MCP1 transmembrane domain-containing protein n=1 Tax=Polysphondylium violaceum TaxID=133409 RepID=A0A8J4Q2X6_9MYCE|nr:hypothetical protein CYY_005519 [Polysphondylium violaceum]
MSNILNYDYDNKKRFLILSTENLQRIQGLTGIVISGFYQLHFVNVIIGSHFREAGFDGLRDLFRQIYQNKFIEPIILGSIGIHLGVNAYLILKRRKYNQELYEKDINSTISAKMPTPYGLYQLSSIFISAFIFTHVSAVRLPILFNPNHTVGFSGIYYTLKSWPLIFYPYYFLFSSSMIYHWIFSYWRICCRAFNISNHRAIEYQSKSSWYKVYGVGALMSTSALLALGGKYFRVLPPFGLGNMNLLQFAKSMFNK